LKWHALPKKSVFDWKNRRDGRILSGEVSYKFLKVMESEEGDLLREFPFPQTPEAS
jgi:hypothetical protein